MQRTTRRSRLMLILPMIAASFLIASCGLFDGDDGDDEPEETPAPTEEAADEESAEDEGEATEENDETPTEDDGTPTGGDGTPEADDEEAPATEETPAADDMEPMEVGEEIFSTTCAACHQPEGEGIEGIYPALDGDSFVTNDDPSALINVVLTGRGGMPSFAGSYSDAEIAGIISYIRSAWDNDASEVTPEDVQSEREALDEQGEANQDEDDEESGSGQTDDTDD